MSGKPNINDFKVSKFYDMDCISWDECERVFNDYGLTNDFKDFMCGQTSCEGGVYLCDVENFLRPTKRRFFD